MKVGNGAIIAAGVVVVKDVDSCSITVEVTVKEARKRLEAKDITILNELSWWDWEEELLRKAIEIMRKGDVSKLKSWHVKNR